MLCKRKHLKTAVVSDIGVSHSRVGCHVGYMVCVKETLTNIVCGVRQNPSVNRYYIEKTNLHYFCVFTEDWKMKIQLAALCLGLTRHRACRSKANFFS